MRSHEVAEAVGHEGETLEQRAARLRQVIATPKPETPEQELARVERQLGEQREAKAKAQAQERVIAIKRAMGSKRTQLDDETKRIKAEADDKELRIVAGEYQYQRIPVLNACYADYRALEVELAALCDRFGLSVPELPVVLPPAQRDIVLPVLGDRIRVFPVTEDCEHGMRHRRNYSECTGSPGYEIITVAGLVPWPVLNARQQEILAEREEAQVRARQLSEQLPKVPDGVLPGGYSL